MRKTIRRISRWYQTLWNDISGKNQQRLHQLQQRLDRSQQHNLELEQQLQEINHVLVELRQTYEQSQQRTAASQQNSRMLQATNHQLAELRQAYEQSQQCVADLKQQLQTSQAQHEQTRQSFNTAVARLETALNQSQQSHASFEERWVNTNNDYITLQEEQIALQREYKAFVNLSDSEIQGLEATLANQQVELGSCYVELGKTKAQVMAETANSDNSQSEPPPLDLSTWKIAMVGGHENMTHSVSEKLRQHYNLKELIKIPPEHIPRQQLRQKLEHCDLVVLIVGYINHALTDSIGALKDRNALKGELLMVNSLGVSGVMRDLIEFLETN
ncbi:MAG: hypothetical protein AAGF93_23985, partial [Cyanobacteria bacterium P01_H01_bin.105]